MAYTMTLPDQADTTLNTLSAAAAAAAIAGGDITSEALVEACLDRIETRDALVWAWVHVDTDRALAEAREADGARRGGQPLGPLHGVPVGIKDIFDTADMPTQCGSDLYRAGSRIGIRRRSRCCAGPAPSFSVRP